MSKIAWATDVHLDFLSNDQKRLIEFGESLVQHSPDAVLLTGDISRSSELPYHLSVLEKIVERPVYFVLGNHDYYGSSFEQVRKQMKELSNMSQFLRYLPLSPYVTISPNTALVGHDGWYDALNGDYSKSQFIMNDWMQISDYVLGGAMNSPMMYGGRSVNYKTIVALSRKMAHEATTHVMMGIKAAAKYHKLIVIATHFPPFKESSMYEGKGSDEGSLPWYTSKMMGEMLRQAAKAYPRIRFEVFAGHTHNKFDGQIEHNLYCHVGHSDYGDPRLQTIITVP